MRERARATEAVLQADPCRGSAGRAEAALQQPVEGQAFAAEALYGFYQQLASVHLLMTELQAASDRDVASFVELRRLNDAWDLLEARLARLRITAKVSGCGTRAAIAAAYQRLHAILESGIVCREATASLMEELRRLVRRLLVHDDERLLVG